ncbi:diaminopimelate decarboxylase [Pseudoalteromonas luteoviolacea]|uniref:Diaminopimelate decarboxylase n=1 Tax=Pseudoalteromonas luteoviolacea TaxID=43657 RepID=A0A1C0TM20_9GAMM|nr:PLP-dependent decarboxylase [Pseudoalteromonas luteoviolacea]MBQ4813422.1 PLP-dependent decarboxylase [Pseudoalteromonas luteoviolacea]OCQ19712.1 diaminopimelate decarboxylase [Pseudoalteromonas luteoviolacea]
MQTLSTPVKAAITELTAQQHEPFYLYDLDQLAKHLKTINDQSIVKLWYAVKANPLSAVIQTLDQAGFDFDVASSGELKQVLSQGIDAKRVLNTGPAKSKQQIEEFLTLGVTTFVAESVNQVAWLQEAALRHDTQLRILLRVQLRWPNNEKNPLGGDSLTPFGLGADEWATISLIDYPNLDFAGLHIFQWGNMLDASKLASLWQQMIAPLVSLSKRLKMNLRILDLGGGLGIPYSREDSAIDWQAILTSLAQFKADAQVDELWMELGRYAVGECGYYLNPIIEQKKNYGANQLILAGGINHLLRPAVTGQAFPATLLRESQATTVPFTLHGPLCTALDNLGEHQLPADAYENDWLLFSQCGAYGFTESMPYFLCHTLPAEFIYQAGEVRCMRAPLTPSEYLR